MTKKYKVDKTEEEMTKFFESLHEMDKTVDAHLDMLVANGVDLPLEMYKYGVSFARLAVLNDVKVDHFINTVLTMYERMGGVVNFDEILKDRDNLTTRKNVRVH